MMCISNDVQVISNDVQVISNDVQVPYLHWLLLQAQISNINCQWSSTCIGAPEQQKQVKVQLKALQLHLTHCGQADIC